MHDICRMTKFHRTQEVVQYQLDMTLRDTSQNPLFDNLFQVGVFQLHHNEDVL